MGVSDNQVTDVRNRGSSGPLRYSATPAVLHKRCALAESSAIVSYTCALSSGAPSATGFCAPSSGSAASIAPRRTDGAAVPPMTRTSRPASRCTANSRSSRRDDHAITATRPRSADGIAPMTANPSLRGNDRSTISSLGLPRRSRIATASSPSRATIVSMLNGLSDARHSSIR